MIKLWQLIKEFFMKATRFILNTDYITSQNDAEFTLSVTLPSSFSVSAAQVKTFSDSKTVKSTASKDYRVWFETTLNNYAVVGSFETEIQYGADYLHCVVQRQKDKWTLVVYNPAPTSAKTYSGASRVITAHIMTFVDPFQL